MVLSRKHSLLERRKCIRFQCKSDMSVEKAFEINQQSSERKEMTEEQEDLQRDVVELNQVLGLIKRCWGRKLYYRKLILFQPR